MNKDDKLIYEAYEKHNIKVGDRGIIIKDVYWDRNKDMWVYEPSKNTVSHTAKGTGFVVTSTDEYGYIYLKLDDTGDREFLHMLIHPDQAADILDFSSSGRARAALRGLR